MLSFIEPAGALKQKIRKSFCLRRKNQPNTYSPGASRSGL